jgi:hypothetical protein
MKMSIVAGGLVLAARDALSVRLQASRRAFA